MASYVLRVSNLDRTRPTRSETEAQSEAVDLSGLLTTQGRTLAPSRPHPPGSRVPVRKTRDLIHPAPCLSPRVSKLPLDLASVTSVRDLARSAEAALNDGSLPPLSAIVCNAGIQFAGGVHRTADGVEETFGVNHLGHFLLVDLLLPHLSPDGRVVVVSSGTHYDAPRIWTSAAFGMPAPVFLGGTQLARGDVPAGIDPESATADQFRYTTSKLCNLLFAAELDRRLRAAGSRVSVNSFDPGLMPGTGLARNNGPIAFWAWNHVLPLLRVFGGINAPGTSGRWLARLVADPALRGVSGGYYEAGRRDPVLSSTLSRQESLAADLWADSEALIGHLHDQAEA